MVLQVEAELICLCEGVEVAFGELVDVVGTEASETRHVWLAGCGCGCGRGRGCGFVLFCCSESSFFASFTCTRLQGYVCVPDISNQTCKLEPWAVRDGSTIHCHKLGKVLQGTKDTEYIDANLAARDGCLENLDPYRYVTERAMRNC